MASLLSPHGGHDDPSKALTSERFRAIYFMPRQHQFVRVPIEDVLRMMSELDQSLVNGYIESHRYLEECAELLDLTGWSEEEVELEIDMRWSSEITRKDPPLS